MSPNFNSINDMRDQKKTKAQLIKELQELQQRIICLEASEAEHQRTEQQLRNSEHKYRALVENLSEVIYSVDRVGTFTYISPQVRSHFGYEPAEVIGASFETYIYSEDVPFLTAQFRKSLAGDSKSSDFRVVSKSGEIRWVRVSSRQKIKRHRVIGLQGVITDITDRVQREYALMRQISLMESIFNGVQEGIGFVDVDETIIFCNPAVAEILEEPLDRLLGRNLLEFFDPETQATILRQTEQRRAGATSSYEVPLMTSRGNQRYLHVTASPRFGKDGTYLGAFGAILDITERKRAEIEVQKTRNTLEAQNHQLEEQSKRLRTFNEVLEEQNKQLSLLNANKDTFFSIISHDLRAPFTGILGITEAIFDNRDTFDQMWLKTTATKLYNSVQAFYALLSNLLTWTQLQRGKIEHQPQYLDIYTIVKRTLSIINPLAEKKRITIRCSFTPPTQIYADEKMIDTVVRNLLSNAVKFTPVGGGIEIAATQTGQFVEVSVADTGIGINPEDLPKLFRIDVKYKRVGTDDEQGTGLGLILCKDFVEYNGGKIWVGSEEGKGSTFTFTVPITQMQKEGVD